MRIRLILILFLVSLICTGCAGSKDTDEFAYALAVGIDKGIDGELIATYQVAVPSKLGGPEGGGEKPPFENISIKAVSLAETRNLANSIIARTLNLTHVKAIIIGEELARDGIANAISPLLRFREFRGSMFVLVTRGTAKDFLDSNKPRLEILPSKYLEIMINSAPETGYYLMTPLHHFYLNMKNGLEAPMATLVGTRKASISDPVASGNKDGAEKTKEYLAGEIPREGLNEVSFVGTAVFRGDKLVYMLTNEETRVVAMLRNEFPRGFLVVEDPLSQKHSINVSIRLGEKPRINLALVDGRAIIDISLFLEGEITAIQSGIHYETKEYRTLLEEQIAQTIKAQVIKTLEITKAHGADVAGFGYHLRPIVGTVSELRNLNWAEMYQQAEIQVDVKASIRRTGLMRKTYPIIK